MIKKIKLLNFRSIENAEVEIAPFTVLYGPTASGKSSLLYSLIVLKNFIINPNQSADGFFHLGFMNLGGFDNCIFNQNKEEAIDIFFYLDENEYYGISLKKNFAQISLGSKIIKMEIEIPVPYTLNRNFTFKFEEKEQEYIVNWNGIAASVSPNQPTAETQSRATFFSKEINKIPEYLKKIDIVPHRRGFFFPNYSPGQPSPNPFSDIDLATIIINDPNLAPKISIDLEKILNRDFRIHIAPGTATAFFLSTDKLSRATCYLVNDGFGVNQIVYLLAKIHRPEIKTILIEEPEVHLHPSMIRALVKILCSIIKEEKKQLILTTHSEVLVGSLLAAIRRKEITPEDVRCYLVVKKQKNTIFEPQKVYENGQIEGGLSSFVEGEIEDLEIFFKKG